jgi:hypothetical protein
MQSLFAQRGWTTGLYGPGPGTAGDLTTALLDMLTVPGPDELIFFYFVGHGGGYRGGRDQPDDNGPPDESQTEDPLPPGVSRDRIDETLDYGPGSDDFIRDDVLGDVFDRIQERSNNWVSGAIDACHANGLLDGRRDIRGSRNKQSVWGTAATEWETAGGSCATGSTNFTRDLRAHLRPDDPLRTLGDIRSWFTRTGEGGHPEAQTYGVKVYEEATSNKCYYPGGAGPVRDPLCITASTVPEPRTLLMFVTGLPALLAARRRGPRRTSRVRP